ncbi:hypothetical protein UC34_14680 [Pandoraea vervacti]|uniref:Ferritin/DPS domain-containing protein n=2 Tax=Pandoraea vervacti TaxID=656178 RepID=A0ABM6FR61_9BURK|nr:hypothetical protein UC34_14680 [Pandoraea vervacti]
MRATCAAEADAIGSMPTDGISGMRPAGTSTSLTATAASPMFLDRLGERLAFERSGVRLYEALISKVENCGDDYGPMQARLSHFRAEEAAHFAMLADCIHQLGADPTAQTPAADVCGVMSMGFIQVLSDPRTDVPQARTALVAIEAADQCGWELLIEMANAEGVPEMAQAFGEALKQENEHLSSVKQWLSEIATAGV